MTDPDLTAAEVYVGLVALGAAVSLVLLVLRSCS